MVKWIRTSGLSIKKSLSLYPLVELGIQNAVLDRQAEEVTDAALLPLRSHMLRHLHPTALLMVFNI